MARAAARSLCLPRHAQARAAALKSVSLGLWRRAEVVNWYSNRRADSERMRSRLIPFVVIENWIRAAEKLRVVDPSCTPDATFTVSRAFTSTVLDLVAFLVVVGGTLNKYRVANDRPAKSRSVRPGPVRNAASPDTGGCRRCHLAGWRPG
jgi:hypothetical protein